MVGQDMRAIRHGVINLSQPVAGIQIGVRRLPALNEIQQLAQVRELMLIELEQIGLCACTGSPVTADRIVLDKEIGHAHLAMALRNESAKILAHFAPDRDQGVPQGCGVLLMVQRGMAQIVQGGRHGSLYIPAVQKAVVFEQIQPRRVRKGLHAFAAALFRC